MLNLLHSSRVLSFSFHVGSSGKPFLVAQYRSGTFSKNVTVLLFGLPYIMLSPPVTTSFPGYC